MYKTRWMQNHARLIERTKASTGDDILVLDGSASLFWEMPIGGITSAELLRVVTPKAKFLLMVRDPAERLYSGFLYFAYRTKNRLRDETRKFTYNPMGFHLAVRFAIRFFTYITNTFAMQSIQSIRDIRQVL